MLTGSDRTYDAIGENIPRFSLIYRLTFRSLLVWGCPADVEEQKKKKLSGQKQLEKQVSCY
jgi:hypothetical protein